ncbi:MAG TPA: hypothetical protein PLN82_15230, partial [Rhodoferax sp.]|nr:hypothetical protein [Rhodoferax sp.]
EARFRAHGAALGRVNERTDLMADPQVLHNGCAVLVPNGGGEPVRVARSAARFDGQVQAPSTGAAHLGEHSISVLQALGFDAQRIDALLANGTVRLPKAPA